MTGPDDGVEFPVTHLRTIFYMRWAPVNMPLVGHLATPGPVAAGAAFAVRFLAAQVQVQTPVGLLVAVNAAVDRLMADAEQTCYLLGTALQAQVMINAAPHLAGRDTCAA